MAARTSRPARRAATPPPDDDTMMRFYRQMVLIRRFEERAARSYTQAEIGGYCHLNLGEEATVVGVTEAMRPGDYLFTNYREHGYALARGIAPGRIMAELYGRSEGVSKGWGGSMHLFDMQARLLGGYGIVGGQLPLATRAALAVDYRGGDDAVVCVMGDGTTNIGAFHETVSQLASESKELASLAQSRRLSASQLSGGTFTISNLGMYGVEHFTAIINPPEGAILAVGGAIPEPCVRDGEIVVRHRMRLTLSADHRIIDGALAARFLAALTALLENPLGMIA